MQISAGNEIWLVDTLKLKCPPIIKDLLEDPGITKIFQDMQYDMALLTFNHECHPTNVFDISLADRLVRQSNNNRKLSNIMEDYLGIHSKIPNKSQKSNWGLRPLTEQQIEYAAYDVMYLPDIYHFFKKKLGASFGYLCLQEYMRKYRAKDYRRKYNIHSMWKVKNIENLSQSELFRFSNLLQVRDHVAKTQNRPIFWVCNEASLLRLAQTNFDKESEIKKFLEKNNSFNRYMRQGFEQLLTAYYLENSENEFLEPPEYGVSLKTWIPINDTTRVDYYPNPAMVLTIKEWQNEVIANLKLIPEFIREKGQTGYIASLDVSKWKNHIEFPGIPESLRILLIEDLIQYLDEERSKLELETLPQFPR